MQRAGATAYAYPGCLPGRGFDETGDKGFLFGEVTEKGADLDFIPFARRRYLSVTADITDRDPAEAVRRALGTRLQGRMCAGFCSPAPDGRISPWVLWRRS